MIYCISDDLPTTSIASWEKFEESCKTPTEFLYKRIVSHVAGYVGEAYALNLNLNKLSKYIEEIGKLMFYVGDEDDMTFDEYWAYEEPLSYRLAPHIKIEKQIDIKTAVNDAYDILMKNKELFSKNINRGRTYFKKKLLESYEKDDASEKA